MDMCDGSLCEKMVLFHIAAIGWISPQTGYKIQNTKLNHIVKTKIRNLKPTVYIVSPLAGLGRGINVAAARLHCSLF